MPPLTKAKKEDLRQGYPPPANVNNVDILAADRQMMINIFNDEERRADPDSILELEVGQACTAIRENAKKKFLNMCNIGGSLYKLMNKLVLTDAKRYENGFEVVDSRTTKIGDFTFVMPSLKKVPRIFEKSVTYATCDEKVNSEVPLLERVVDILRGTLVLERKDFLLHDPQDGGPNLGSRIIDLFNTEFDGALVQVKNRFNDLRKPILYNYTADDYAKALEDPNSHVVTNELADQLDEQTRENRYANKNLVNNIATMVNSQLRGRDTFYRDLQLLFKLPNNDLWKNYTRMTHVYFELQITTRELFAAKSVHAADNVHGSGHDQYVKIRRVMEYCEYLYWAWKKRQADNAFKYAMPKAMLDLVFKTPLKADYLDFRETLEAMWKLYASNCPKYRGAISGAINDSTWYKNINQQ